MDLGYTNNHVFMCDHIHLEQNGFGKIIWSLQAIALFLAVKGKG